MTEVEHRPPPVTAGVAGGTQQLPTPPPGPWAPPSSPGFMQPGPATVQPRRHSRMGGALRGAAIVVALGLSAAALVVSLTRPTAANEAPPAQPAASAPTVDEHALCQAFAPLMIDNTAKSKAYSDLGPAGSPARDAATVDYARASTDWARRAQAVLDEHVPAGASTYATRSLQRYVDDTRMLAANLRPGPGEDGDKAAWNDRLVALAGAYESCQAAGVELWQR